MNTSGQNFGQRLTFMSFRSTYPFFLSLAEILPNFFYQARFIPSYLAFYQGSPKFHLFCHGIHVAETSVWSTIEEHRHFS